MLNRTTGGVAYMVGAPYRGQELAARALGLLTKYATDVAGTPSTYLEIEADNAASIAVARRAGFRPTDAAPESVEDKGRSYALFCWVKQP